MKLILTADLHCQDGIYVNICIDYIDYLARYAKKNEITKIVILGDIFHKSNKVKYDTFVPLFKKLQELKEMGLELYFIVGNHDIYTMDGDTIVETFSPFGRVIKSAEEFEFDGIKINMCPYTTDSMEVPTVNADYLFTHLPIDEFCFDNGLELKDKNSFNPDFFTNYKKVFTGHYHKRQQKYNIEYVGSPYQLSFGEAGDKEKGFVVFEPSTGNEEFVRYTLAPTYMKITYDSLMEEGFDTEEVKNSFVKIVIDKKIENFSKIRNVLYKAGVIDIIPEYEQQKVKSEKENEVKVEMDKPMKDMLLSFISKKEFYYMKEKLDNRKMVEFLQEIESEL